MSEQLHPQMNNMSDEAKMFARLKPQKTETAHQAEPSSWEEKWKEIKEKQWETDLGLLVISGKPGAGTSTAARILASLYKAKLYKAGDTIRELSRATDRTKTITRDPEVDNIVDGEVRKMTMNATKGQPAIAEAQIGAITAHEAIQGTHPKAPILRMLFWATKEERVRRLKADSDEHGENKTIQQIREETTEREHDDLAYWKNLYPTLIGKDNPLEKGALDAKGNEIYNTPVFDNTDWKTPERSAYEVHKFLSEMGMVRPQAEMQRDESIFLGYKPEDNLLSTDLLNPF